MNRTHRITEQDIQRALRRFRREGRLIRRLPEQVALHLRMVGARHAAYENPFQGGTGPDGF
jgi:hypothetical protein